MQEIRFHREDYPLELLAEIGLTEQMIYDLPNQVHEVIEMGGMSPLLPIAIAQPFGQTRGYAKFCLFDTDEGIEVLLSPKLNHCNLDAFSEQEQEALLAGKVIVADVEEPFVTDEGVEDVQRTKAFVQLDKDTNGVLYSPTQIIGRNINAISNEYDLTSEDLEAFWRGELVTVTEPNGQGGNDAVTIGVDLLADKGVIVIPGSAEHWVQTVRKPLPRYSFGNDGCWVNKDGLLSYVPEESFTKDILDELDRMSRRNGMVQSPEQELRTAQEQQPRMAQAEEDTRQLVR